MNSRIILEMLNVNLAQIIAIYDVLPVLFQFWYMFIASNSDVLKTAVASFYIRDFQTIESPKKVSK